MNRFIWALLAILFFIPGCAFHPPWQHDYTTIKAIHITPFDEPHENCGLLHSTYKIDNFSVDTTTGEVTRTWKRWYVNCQGNVLPLDMQKPLHRVYKEYVKKLREKNNKK